MFLLTKIRWDPVGKLAMNALVVRTITFNHFKPGAILIKKGENPGVAVSTFMRKTPSLGAMP